MKRFLKEHPVAAYYLITFVWTWAIVLALVVTGQGDDMNHLPITFILAGMISNVSPSVAAFLVSWASEGREGVQRLQNGFAKKVSVKWLALSLFTVPVITALTTLLSSFTVRPYRLSVVLPAIAMGLIWPLISGTGEEFGWRGYILPKLLARYSTLKAGVILGLVWAAWHVPMYCLAYRNYGDYLIPAIGMIGFANLTVQSILMAFIYVKSKGSIKLMILYHYTTTASSIIVGAMFVTDPSPALAVKESFLFVALFAVWAAVLYLRDRNKTVKTEAEAPC